MSDPQQWVFFLKMKLTRIFESILKTCFYSTDTRIEDAANARYWGNHVNVNAWHYTNDREWKKSSENKRSIIFHFVYEWGAFKLCCRSFCWWCMKQKRNSVQNKQGLEWIRTLIECQSGHKNDDWKPHHLGNKMTISKYEFASVLRIIMDAKWCSRKFAVLRVIVTLHRA